MTTSNTPTLTVVIPSYNSVEWLPSTLDALESALERSGVTAEILVVDDGSTDDTEALVESLALEFSARLRVIRQENRGRFLARWAGLEAAGAELVLLLDSRVLLPPDSLRDLLQAVAVEPAIAGWNAHVRTDSRAALVGSFWEVPTHVFWGRYLRNPRPFDLTPETFDSAPKGTGAFLARRGALMDAFRHAWPEGDARLISDDTKILRWLAEQGGIRLFPAFEAIYRPRTTVRGFIRHSFDRGTLFVDSYAGTSLLRSVLIILGAFAPVLVLGLLVWLTVQGAGIAALIVLLVLVLLGASPVIPAAINRCTRRGMLSYVLYLPVFVVPFWAGLVRGVLIHRRAFRKTARNVRTPGEAHQ